MPSAPRASDNTLLISYSHRDVIWARTLKRALEKHENTVWLDEHDIQFGDSISDRLAEMIWKVDFLLVLISPRSLASQWVHWELSVAHQRERLEGTKRILPILIQGEHVPATLSGRLFADFRTKERQDSDFAKLVVMLLARRAASGGQPFNTDLFEPDRSEWLRVPPPPVPPAADPRLFHEKSPMTGTLYRAVPQGARPLVDLGAQVRAGDPLVYVEAMKIINEIEATVDGTVESFLVGDGDTIEFGQPFAVVRRSA